MLPGAIAVGTAFAGPCRLLPMVGAAPAAADRKVVCPHGAAAYTMQALWITAREKLDVTTVIYANRPMRSSIPGGRDDGRRNARPTLDLHNPEMNWTQIASGLGFEASRPPRPKNSPRNMNRR